VHLRIEYVDISRGPAAETIKKACLIIKRKRRLMVVVKGADRHQIFAYLLYVRSVPGVKCLKVTAEVIFYLPFIHELILCGNGYLSLNPKSFAVSSQPSAIAHRRRSSAVSP
jgi:ribosomal protein L36